MNLLFLLLLLLSAPAHSETDNIKFSTTPFYDESPQVIFTSVKIGIMSPEYAWVFPSTSTWKQHEGECLRPSTDDKWAIYWSFFKCK